ncbi:hypothetical protein WH47_11893 [Habropoda laboriosa]|uniref:Uncharacterized protein n=1 Tax=Habropoda laboriosa TaxID=597456 RepID=A0A0L7QL87_9HYME|nr:hypothetical protein WH47_11893 [Habropoda laboriosa]
MFSLLTNANLMFPIQMEKLCQQIQRSNNTKNTIRNFKNDYRCSLVCNKPNLARGPIYSIRQGSNTEKQHTHYEKVENHSITSLHPLLKQYSERRRLKRQWPADLIDG